MIQSNMKTIRLPKLLTIGWSHILFNHLDAAINHSGPVTLNFEEVDWAAPFGLTAISVVLEKCLNQGKDIYFSPPKNALFKSYLERIGFRYHFLKGEEVEHKKTSVELKRLWGIDPGCSEALVKLISTNFPLSDDAEYEMRIHINELMTNSFDHSKTKFGVYVCAQWYPAKKNLRISFADGGIGIFQSLRGSGKFPEVKNDIEAIRLAIKPGITTRKKQLGGLGLDYIKKYVRSNDGTLTIASGRGKVNFYKNKIENKYEPIGFEGTIVDILVSPKQISGFKKRKKHDLF
jgi:hypothetical protein